MNSSTHTNKGNPSPDTSSKPTIKIEWTSDYSECDTCGFNYSDGANVWLDDKLVLELVPVAGCYDGDHWDQRQVYRLILDALGYTVTEE